MNKRVVDGPGVWKSDKLLRVQPEWMRAEYANWLPLALANGVFEADTRRVWSNVYSYNRPNVSYDDADLIRREFFRVGLLFLWMDEPSGKLWGYFTGIEKPGRLPPKSRQDKKHEPIGPTPAEEALRSYVELTRSKPMDSATASHWLAKGYLGFGSGFGSGLGESHKERETLSEPLAPGVCDQLLAFWNANCGPLPKVLKLTKDRKTKILSRVKADPKFPETFRAATVKASKTPFCSGESLRGWKTNFDWLVANERNAVKVLEGTYDGGKGASGNGKVSRDDLVESEVARARKRLEEANGPVQ